MNKMEISIDRKPSRKEKETLEMKRTITDLKSLLERVKGRFEQTEERVSKV
jgi:hypothetical protein